MAGKTGRREWGWIRKLASGRYQASYVGPDLARHYATGTYGARMDAEHWLSEERRLVDRGIWTSPKIRAAQAKAETTTLGEYGRASSF
jgi:hypothetical protein